MGQESLQASNLNLQIYVAATKYIKDISNDLPLHGIGIHGRNGISGSISHQPTGLEDTLQAKTALCCSLL